MNEPNPVRLLLASGNPGKLREVRHALEPHGVTLLASSDVDLPPFPPEDAPDYRGNAAIKAHHAAKASGLPALADDSGIEVDALGGAPGVHSARFGGPGLDDADRVALLLERLTGVPEEERSARFRASLVLALPDGRDVVFEGACEGRILHAPAGTQGFGYDPVFFSLDLNEPFGTASLEAKRSVSHRGRALAHLATWLDTPTARSFVDPSQVTPPPEKTD